MICDPNQSNIPVNKDKPAPHTISQSPSHNINNNLTSEHFFKRNIGAIAGVFISRLLGLFRTVIINAYFGANIALDAFNAAFRFPNSLRDLFADGALSAAFTKALVDIYPLGLHKQRELIAIVSGCFLVITCLLSLLAVFFAEPFMYVMSDPKFQASGGLILASDLFRWLAFYLPLTMLNAIVMAILGTIGLTFRAMNGSLFLSIGTIGIALALAPFLANPIYGLAWGALGGAVMQLIYQAMPLKQRGLLPFPNLNPFQWISYKPLGAIFRMITPRAIGQGAATLALMVNTYFALTLGSGALTFVATTMIIIQVPIGLFGVATGFASLPVLTEAVNQKQFRQFSKLLTQSLDISLWLAALTTLAFALLIVPFYIAVFQHGKISFSDTIQNTLCICAYASGITFASGSKILLNTLYALNATKSVVINSVVYLVLSGLLSMMLVPHYGLIGLGLAFGLASATNYWINYGIIIFAYRHYEQSLSPYQAAGKLYWLKNCGYTLVGFCASLLGIYLTQQWPFLTTYLNIQLTFLNACIILLIGGLFFISMCTGLTYCCGPSHLKNVLRKKYVFINKRSKP